MKVKLYVEAPTVQELEETALRWAAPLFGAKHDGQAWWVGTNLLRAQVKWPAEPAHSVHSDGGVVHHIMVGAEVDVWLDR